MSRFSQSRAVTPSDTANIYAAGKDICADAIMVTGTAGNLSLVLEDGSTLPITNAAQNSIWEFAVKRVNASCTTATNIVALKY